jgi:trehalose/maltose transport system substrate-binding protein
MWRALYRGTRGLRCRVIAAGLLLSTGTALAGCSAANGAQAPQPDPWGPITFAIGNDDINWLTPIIDSWNKAHPAQRVTVFYLPSASNLQLDQLVANLQAKSPVYDVIDMDVVWTAQFASNGWILPLSARDFGNLDGFFGSAVSTAKYQGRLYAVPDYTNADLLFYRKDILAAAHKQPPTTWKQLQYLASTVAPKYHLYGYAGTFAQYEGLTVNFASAVQSAGGSILNKNGAVTLTTPAAAAGLASMVDGFKDGWIPEEALGFEENQEQQQFLDGKFLFLDDWPDTWAYLAQHTTDPDSKYGIVAIPGQDGPGSSSLGGANLAISAYSQHPKTALAFIQYLTEPQQQRTMLELGSFPPVLEDLYTHPSPSLLAQFPYLHTLEESITRAQPRPAITNYDQASLVIASEVFQALEQHQSVPAALHAMQKQLTQIIKDG